MAIFLFKTEPSSYSFENLVSDKRAVWDGVANPAALRHMSSMHQGDTVVIYHTGDERQAVGLAVAISDPYPDPKLRNPKRLVIDIRPDQALPKPVTLAQVKADPVLKASELARLPRLSVMPLSAAQFRKLLSFAGVS
jgi:predicted RNA-binding protein with PUA-like domain